MSLCRGSDQLICTPSKEARCGRSCEWKVLGQPLDEPQNPEDLPLRMREAKSGSSISRDLNRKFTISGEWADVADLFELERRLA